MDLKYENVGGKNYGSLIGDIMCPGYMTEMIIRNNPGMIIPMRIIDYDGKSRIMYETDTGMTLKDYFSDCGADEVKIRYLLYSIDRMLAICGDYLLDKEYIMMAADCIHTKGKAGGIRFIFNPFEKMDFQKSCKNLLVDILGNYFSGYSIEGEKLRERLLREINKKDFNVRNLLFRWDDMIEHNVSGIDIESTADKRETTQKSLLKGIMCKFNRQPPIENDTVCVTNNGGGMCLTGICSVNTKIPIITEGITVGRNMLQKDFGLYNSGIGKTHARVYEKDGTVYATDLGSKNGTYLNGERLEKRNPVKIERGDILAFYDEEFILC